MKHRYLFILEVVPVEVGKTYDELPSHLTLMSRFFSELSPAEVAEAVRPLFEQMEPIELVFGEAAKLGPKKLTVHLVEHSSDLRQLHNKLLTLLDSIDVKYEYPQFVGEGHKPHVTKRESVQFSAGDRHTVSAISLIKVVNRQRTVRSRFILTQAF